jgi:VanZ family protein
MKKQKKINKQSAIIYWFFTIGYMGLIFYSSSIAGNELPLLPHGFDKIIHISIYAILAFLSYISFRKSGLNKYVLLLSFFFATLYGITNEFYQFYVPGRDASIGDIVANSCGALLGSYLASVISLRRI